MQQVAADILLQKRHSVIKIYCKGDLRLINHDDHPVSMRVLLLYQPQLFATYYRTGPLTAPTFICHR